MTGREFHYHRVYADDQGESHFEDVTVPVKTVDYAPPAPPLDHVALGDAATLALIGSDDAWEGEIPHPPLRASSCSSFKGHASKFFGECILAAVQLAQ